MKRQAGFTIIELMIVIVILFMVLPATFLVAGKLYTQQKSVIQRSELRQSARKCAAEIKRDISAYRDCRIKSDNHGIAVMSPAGSIAYSLKNGALIRKDGRGEVKLTESTVSDLIFVRYGARVVMTITFEYYSISGRRNEKSTFMEAVRM